MNLPIHLFNEYVIEDEAMDADITSSSKNVNEAVSYAVHAIWSDGSSPVGTLDLQASNDDDDASFTSILSAPYAVSGNSGKLIINVEKHGYGYIRIVYTRTSGDGTLNVKVNAKRG